MTAGERQNNRSALSHERFFELTVDPLCVIDRNGFVAEANPALIDLLGYPRDELISMHVSKIIDPEQESAAMELLGSIKPSEPITSLELRCRHKDGSHRIIVWSIQPDAADGSLYASGRDLTESRAAERSLHESEERLRLATKAGNLHTWEADIVGEELHWSREDPQLVDVPLPRTFDEFHAALHEDDRDGVINALRHAIATEGEFRFEYRFANDSSSNPSWLWSTGIAFRDEDAGVVRIVGITQDISDRIRRQRQSEFLAQIGSDFSRLTSTDLVLRSVSDRALQFFEADGLSIAEIDDGAGSVSFLFDSKQTDRELRSNVRLDQFVSDSMIGSLKRGEVVAIPDVETDERTRERAQSYKRIEVGSMLAVPFTRHGRLQLVLTVIRTRASAWRNQEIELLREIAYRIGVRVERARAEDALRESEARYRSLFTSIDEGFCVLERIDPGHDDAVDYRYLSVNPAFTSQTGIQVQEGDTVRQRFPEEREIWYETFDSVLRSNEPIRVVRDLISTDRVLELYAFPLDHSPGDRLGLIFQDITEQKQFEAALQDQRREAEQAVHARDVFLSIASHELRNPVASVKGSAQLLRRSFERGRLDQERTDRLTAALVDSSDRLALLLEDLLDVSRLQSGQMRLLRQPTDMAELARDLISEEYPSPEAHVIHMDVAEGEPVMIDRERIRQVLRNAMDNAIKYSPESEGIWLTVHHDSEHAHVEVRDLGIGIAPYLLESVFQPFGRAPNAAESNIPGMGLGLYICRNIALAHGGWLWIESEGESRGLTVHLTIPHIGQADDQ